MNFDINESPPKSSPSSYSNSSPPCTVSSSQPHNLMMSSSSSHKRKAGRKKFKETRHPIYRGVRRRNGNKWVCEVREPNKKTRIWLGTYPTPEMAARAHDVAALALKGTSASFNFPDSPLVLPLARSSSPTHIREAIESFKPKIMSGDYNDNKNQIEKELGSCMKIKMHCVEGDGIEIGNDKNEVSKTMFLDEEALYNMPGLLDSMAEGLLITPPSMKRALDWDDDIGCELIDLNLWGD